MLQSWVEFGQDPSRFWCLTYREIDAVLQGVRRKMRREHNERAWMAWHTAALTAYAPDKFRKFTKLEKLMWKEPPKPQSIAEMRDVARRWVESLHKSSRHKPDAGSERESERNAKDDQDEDAGEA